MQFEYNIAKRLFFKKDKKDKRLSIRIAIIGISVGLVVMLLSIFVVVGFKRNIRDNLSSVASDIRVESYYSSNTYEMAPITVTDSVIEELESFPFVKGVQKLFTKTGIVKTNNNFQAAILKGVDEKFDYSFLNKSIIQGSVADFKKGKNNVLVSLTIANLLNLKINDSFYMYFVKGTNILARKFKISGIYQTNITSFDNNFIIVDAKNIVKLNSWSDLESSGLEIFLKNKQNFSEKENKIYSLFSSYGKRKDMSFFIKNLYQIYQDVFGWLNLLDMNIIMIIVLMIFVSGFNIISGLLILILEKTNFIGTIKALGLSNKRVRKVFLWLSVFIILKGLMWGNIIACSICFIQNKFHLLTLDPSTYFISYVPMTFDISYFLIVNIATILISLLVVLIPTILVAKIDPIKSIRFD